MNHKSHIQPPINQYPSHVRLPGLDMNLPQGEPNPSSILRHDTSSAGIKRQERADDGKRSPVLVDPDGSRRVAGLQELSRAEEEEGQEEGAEHEQDGDVCLERGDEEDEGQEAPQDEEDAQGEAVGSVVPPVRVPDGQVRHEEHGIGEPEGAVRAVGRRAEGVADAELHQAGKELGDAAKEDGQPKDGLVRAGAAKGVRSREAIHGS